MNHSNEKTSLSYLEAIKQRGSAANPFFLLMDISVVHIGDGEAMLEMTIRNDMHNGAGWLQGGLFVSLADEAMALALFTVLDQKVERIATISESTSYLRGVRSGKLIALGKVVKQGRRVAFTEGEVRHETPDGDLLTRTTASFAIIRS